MAAIVHYSTSPSRMSSTNQQNQYGSYGSVNKSILNTQSHHQSQLQHHHMTTMHPMSSPAPLSIYHGKEHHNNYYTMSHRNYKRKSAVEILNQTKSYYVKSETVLDHQQQLGARGGSNTLSCE